MSDHSVPCEEEPYYSPGPVDIVYGVGSPVALPDVARHISSAKKRRRPVRHLGFLGCKFRDGTRRSLRVLGRKLRRVHVVEELAVRDVPGVDDEALASIAPFLNSNATLRSLDLTGAEFDGRALEGVRPFLSRNPSLEKLVLGENPKVGDEGVEAVVSALRAKRRGGRLRVLAMESCGAGARGASSVADFLLAGGGSLRVLELSNNGIGDAGAETLIESMRRGHRLGHLGLNNADIGDRTALSFGELLKTNRSLHTLSLQNNARVTDVGASSMLKAIYNTDSIEKIIGSNHVLRDLNLRGCGGVSPDLLKLSAQVCARSRMLSREGDVVRWKISKHMTTAKCGMPLDDFVPGLMPRMLEFVGRAGGMTNLFHTLMCTPLLFTQYDPEASRAKSLVEEGATEERADGTFLERLKLSSRRARRYYSVFADLVPQRSTMLRYQDRRVRNKHESTVSAKINSQLSSIGGNTAFARLNVYYTVLRRALLLWLFSTRLAVWSSALVVSKLCPQASMLFVIFQP